MARKPYKSKELQMHNHEAVAKIEDKRLDPDWRNRVQFIDFYIHYREEFNENAIQP